MNSVTIAVIVGAIVGAIVILVAPILQIHFSLGGAVNADRRFELEDQARKTWTQIVGGVVVLIGFIATYESVVTSKQAQETAKETQFSNSFATATDDLAAPEIEARLGGIYALERLAEDSDPDKDYRQIRQVVEVLCAYVREHAPAKPELEILPSQPSAPDPPPKAPEPDVQAILTVLGRQTRTPENVREGIYVYPLYETDLRYADLHEAALQKANLWRTNLQGADLSGADLRGAYLGEANLQGANLAGTKLAKADLTGADLRQTKNLSQEQIDQTVHGDQTTLLPPGRAPSPDWGEELDIPVQISLPPKEYFPNKFELVRSFRVGEGWTSDGQGSDHLYLAHTNTDSKLSVVRPQTAFDTENPTQITSLPGTMEDLMAWFQAHPYLTAHEPDPLTRGDFSGKQFDTRADAPLGVGFLECIDPCVPLFLNDDESRLVLFEGHEIRTVVSEVGGETVIVTIESPTDDAFDSFLPKAMRVLGTVEWQAEQ